MDTDPFITDQQLCTSGGGVIVGVNCTYIYPRSYSLQFNPGQPTAQGYNVTQSANCPSQFYNAVDPHGAVHLIYNVAFSQAEWVTFSSATSCVVSVFVKK